MHSFYRETAMSTMTEHVAIPANGTLTPLPARARERLLSLDVFRGMTLVLMTYVNNHGDERLGYPPFLHAKWHGWTPTDLVFPFSLSSWEWPFLLRLPVGLNVGKAKESFTPILYPVGNSFCPRSLPELFSP